MHVRVICAEYGAFWIAEDVLEMRGEVAFVPDPMVAEAGLPDLHRQTQLLLDAKGKASFDELNGAFHG